MFALGYYPEPKILQFNKDVEIEGQVVLSCNTNRKRRVSESVNSAVTDY